MNSQFESIQAFIGTVLQYLPPPAAAAAQNILQQPINQDNKDQEKVNAIRIMQKEWRVLDTSITYGYIHR
ncbi:unnamed protein product [Sphenostylis stenocarpa]|uniref:Uncharacterized protein n=1 Tax=Sphenostylis stenocarpa TaxID=92480 RepID=A0AA86SQJ5_9FABA|nr:unnamed protein product [Sphenostylis stenocarpa]